MKMRTRIFLSPINFVSQLTCTLLASNYFTTRVVMMLSLTTVTDLEGLLRRLQPLWLKIYKKRKRKKRMALFCHFGLFTHTHTHPFFWAEKVQTLVATPSEKILDPPLNIVRNQIDSVLGLSLYLLPYGHISS